MPDPQNPVMQTAEFRLMDLERQVQVQKLQIESLLEVTKAINNNFSTDALYRIFGFMLSSQLGVDEYVLFIKKDEWQTINISEVGLEKVAGIEVVRDLYPFHDSTELSADVWKHDYFDYVIPVYHKDDPLAFCLIGDIKLFENDNINEKIKLIQTILNIITVAIENKRLFKKEIEQQKFHKELELAAKMQNLLIPDSLPKNHALEMNGIYKPHTTIGGDYYDTIKLNDEEYIFAIADISGKGIAAAILMANFQAILHTLVNEDYSLKRIITKLNNRVLQITQGDKFITLFIAKYNESNRHLQYINAGHNPSLLISPDGHIESLESGCTILGMFDELPHVISGNITVPENALLVNYTDGLIDLQDNKGELFEMERLSAFSIEHRALDPEVFNEKLMEYIIDYKEDQSFVDDISLLTARFF